MRLRSALLVPTAVALLVSLTTPAHAANPRPRPQVTIGQLTDPSEGFDGEQEWWLSVDAIDPDGVIWEVTVQWGDGLVAWATTGCVQGADPGTPAHLIIPHSYAKPGRYRVTVEASSLQACPFYGPGGVEQSSRPVTKLMTVSR